MRGIGWQKEAHRFIVVLRLYGVVFSHVHALSYCPEPTGSLLASTVRTRTRTNNVHTHHVGWETRNMRLALGGASPSEWAWRSALFTSPSRHPLQAPHRVKEYKGIECNHCERLQRLRFTMSTGSGLSFGETVCMEGRLSKRQRGRKESTSRGFFSKSSASLKFQERHFMLTNQRLIYRDKKVGLCPQVRLAAVCCRNRALRCFGGLYCAARVAAVTVFRRWCSL